MAVMLLRLSRRGHHFTGADGDTLDRNNRKIFLRAGDRARGPRAQSASKQHASELQLNAGDGQYVVAYTLKPHKQAQPDILNPPPDGSPPAKRVGPVKNGALHTTDEWPDERRVSIADKVSILSTSTISSKPITVSSTAISRREHLIAEEIPGPESCV
ncbi:jg2373 [Pararge aegeria aegeria]|uniref:Jg2373 protein n=1 Tax=Pararge aegeria aegeria TaxID=348720 RepID=A0A8S4R0K4_9NEOP|nr:jg2373 [Pararge aegeria aegeria]